MSNQIPQNLKVPLFYAEMDASQAGSFSQNKRMLLIGQKLPVGTAKSNRAIIVNQTDQAYQLFGIGSMLARMHATVRNTDNFSEIWCIALDDNPAAAAATGTITVTGQALVTGAISLYIAGQKISVAVIRNDTAFAVAASISAAINIAYQLPVTSTASNDTVTLTCKWGGDTGNSISVKDSFLGLIGGESMPQGISLAYSGNGFLSGGAVNPVIASHAIASMGDEEYDYVIHPYADTASLNDFQVEYNDVSGRWAWNRMIYGHCYTARQASFSDLITFGMTRNDPHHTIVGYEPDCPHPVWEYAAAYGAANAIGINADVARPTQTLPLVGILPACPGERFVFTERQSLLSYGIATSIVSSGNVVRIERAITTYQKNAFGATDPSYFDSETLHTSAEIIRRLRSIITTKYPRHKLADDGTRFGAGQAIVTPNIIRGELVGEYARMELLGLVENRSMFQQHLIVQRNQDNPNRLDVLFPPDYINQLRIFALLNQFRLQYPVAVQ